MVNSVLVRPRGIVFAYGIVICFFAVSLLFSPAGWPFYPRENCTRVQWIFARTAIPITVIQASVRFGLDESKRRLRADATGFTLIDSSTKSWSFEWGDVSRWGMTRGAWRTTESEGGTQYENFTRTKNISFVQRSRT